MASILLAAAGGCSDFSLQGNGSGAQGEPYAPAIETSSEPADSELCNGVDDDGDGRIDEGYGDGDLDQVADCVDLACAVVVEPAGIDGEPRQCGAVVPTPGATWDVQTEDAWEVAGNSCFQTIAADLDRDGFAEVVCAGAFIVSVLDGASRTTGWSAGTGVSADGGIGGNPAVAAADINGDGFIEVVFDDNKIDSSVRATDPSGKTIWETPGGLGVGEAWQSWIGLADLEGDCRPLVVTERSVLEGTTGVLEYEWSAPPDRNGGGFRNIAIGDVDADGTQDVFFDWKRQSDGNLIWVAQHATDSNWNVSPVLLQADADDDGEIAWVAEEGLRVDDADGTELLYAAPPDDDEANSLGCVGDLDGDGLPEVVAQGAAYVWAWTLDGGTLWVQSAPDSSGAGEGCSVFDFDGDERQEVVFTGETRVAILDGTTGAVLWSDDDRFSGTLGEVPGVADLNGDGVAELISPGVAAYYGAELEIYASADASWPPGTTIWSSPNWSGTEMRPDGSVPRYPARPWLEYNLFHGQPVNPVFGADMKVTITDACTDSCAGGLARVAVQVSNLGPEGAPDDTPVSVYTIAADGSRALVQEWTIGRLLWPGQSVAGVEVYLPGPDAIDGVVAVVGQSGAGTACAVPDCDSSNNETTWTPDCAAQ